MSTLATKAISPSRRRMLRATVTGGLVALFCVVFTAVYEQFSHGAVSGHMRCMFLMPLAGCALPCLIGFLTPLHRLVSRTAFNLWNSVLAVNSGVLYLWRLIPGMPVAVCKLLTEICVFFGNYLVHKKIIFKKKSR